MTRSWWWKTTLVLLFTAMAVAYLLPTVLGPGKLPKWYGKYVDAELQLGLDLQGGIHLVFEVEIDKAVSDKADRLATDLEDRLREDKKTKVVAERQQRGDIVLRFDKAEQLNLVDDDFMGDFQTNLDEVERSSESKTIRLRMNEDYLNDVQEYAIRQAMETIRGRVDEFGVAEPTILRKGRDIVVELPGLTQEHFERVKRVIGRTAQLEFRICDDEGGYMRQIAARVDKESAIEVKTDFYDGKQRGSVTHTYLESTDKKALEVFLAKVAKEVPLPADREILVGEDQAKDEKGEPLPGKVWLTYFLRRRTELTGEYITDAQVEFDQQTSRSEVGLTFDRTGGSIFAKVSGDNIGRRMAIVLDDRVVSAPVLQDRITGGRARITLGGFRAPNVVHQEATDLAAVLRSGALPAPLRKTFERQVGPTLGQDAIERGALAFLIGGMLVVLFILYYYRGSGLVCDVALILNFIFIMAIMAGFHATLTLPGIAGLVLTVGMVVDANVIIYERIREEARLGRTPRAAVEAGYSRAFWTIFDAQLTTAIAGFVLLQYGSGPIRGFALTLLIGILCSVFTGVVVTRLLLDFVVTKFKPKQLSI